MYITLGGVSYQGVTRYRNKSTGSVIYTGASLTGIESVSGVIGVYRDDGMHLRDDDTAGFIRKIINSGSIILTNRPEPGPAPEPEPTVYDEMAAAITEGVNSI